MARHYLDHASTAPLRPEAAEAITSWMTSAPAADPGRPYAEGRRASEAVEQARADLAAFVGVEARQVIFTSGGTEAANWANLNARARARPESPIICAGVEHSAVRLAAERSGPVTALRVDALGRIDLDHLVELLADTPAPALVHCQAANHEVGTVQPLEAAIAICAARGVPVHVDACAALGHTELALGELGADLISLSAHKLGGPPGIGALVIGRRTRVTPMLVGGDQERARRAGLENVLGIVGFGAAARALDAPGVLADELARARAQTHALALAALGVEGVVGYGDATNRLAHLCCFGVGDVESEAVLLGLDQAGIAVHSGSACSSEALEPSPVLEAMGVDAEHSLRCSVGWSTTADDVAAFVESFPTVVAALRALRS